MTELKITIEDEKGNKVVGVNHNNTNFEFYLKNKDGTRRSFIRHLDQDRDNTIDELFEETREYYAYVDKHLSPEEILGPKKNGALWLSTKAMDQLPLNLVIDLDMRWEKKSDYNTFTFTGWHWHDSIEECFEWGMFFKKLQFGDYTFSLTPMQLSGETLRVLSNDILTGDIDIFGGK